MRRAFTLIELLVVVSIIALLIAILLPALSAARQSAGTIVCMSNTAQMSLANEMFANDNDEHYPYNNWLHPDANGGGGAEWVEKYQAGTKTRVVYWMVNEQFLEYMGFTEEQIRNVRRSTNNNEAWGAQWPDDYLCPQWVDQDDIYNHRNSYGYSRGKNSKRVNVAHRPTIPNPSEAYAHMDAGAWHMTEDRANYLTNWDVDPLGNGVAYRHKEATNVSFFDGHTETLAKTDMFHFQANGTTPDNARNAEHWTLRK